MYWQLSCKFVSSPKDKIVPDRNLLLSIRLGPRKTAGFTLIELLVVIAIIGTLISILLPTLRTVKITTNRMLCAAQVKQITMGLLIIADENDGKFPEHGSNLTDVSNHQFNLKPTLRAVVPVANTFYCPSTWGKDSYRVDRWDDPSMDNQQHGTDYAIHFGSLRTWTIRTSIYQVEQPAEEVMVGDLVIGSHANWDSSYSGYFPYNAPFISNHPVGYECVNGRCPGPGGFGVPPAGANWGAYDGHAEWRHVKKMRYLGWGGAGPWRWYN